MIKFISVFFLLVSIVTSSRSFAAAKVSPVAIGIAPPVQFPADDYTITGLRFSLLWGKHRDLYGLDFGLLGNVTSQAFTGMAASGIFNITRGTTTIIGLQLAGLTNINTNKTDVYGVQFALGLNSNEASGNFSGLQMALVNLSPHANIYGLQVGLYNKAQEVYGLQIGIVNSTANLHGIQIGLVNFNDKGIFGVSPILNVGF